MFFCASCHLCHLLCLQACAPSVGSPVGTAGHLLHRTTAKTMEVLTTTGLTTKAVLTAVSDHRWWKESLNYLRPQHVRSLFFIDVICGEAEVKGNKVSS